MRNQFCLALVAWMITAAQAHAQQYQTVNFDAYLSNVTQTLSLDPSGGGMSLRVQGEFRVPTLPAGAKVSSLSGDYSFSGDLGLFAWLSPQASLPVLYGYTSAAAISLATGEAGPHFSSSTSGLRNAVADGFQFSPAANAAFGFSRLATAFVPGSVYDNGGYFSLFFNLTMGVGAASDGVSGSVPPSLLLYGEDFRLQGSFAAASADGSVLSDLHGNAPATPGLDFIASQIGSGGASVPTELLSQMSTLVPAVLPAVPEPSSNTLWLLGAAALVSLRLNTKRRVREADSGRSGKWYHGLCQPIQREDGFFVHRLVLPKG